MLCRSIGRTNCGIGLAYGRTCLNSKRNDSQKKNEPDIRVEQDFHLISITKGWASS